jgi:hypothetical protein
MKKILRKAWRASSRRYPKYEWLIWLAFSVYAVSRPALPLTILAAGILLGLHFEDAREAWVKWYANRDAVKRLCSRGKHDMQFNASYTAGCCKRDGCDYYWELS